MPKDGEKASPVEPHPYTLDGRPPLGTRTKEAIRLWTEPSGWPRQRDGYLFLVTAVHRLGEKLFGTEWLKCEPYSTLSDHPPSLGVLNDEEPITLYPIFKKFWPQEFSTEENWALTVRRLKVGRDVDVEIRNRYAEARRRLGAVCDNHSCDSR